MSSHNEKNFPKKTTAFNHTKTVEQTYARSILIKNYLHGKAKKLMTFTKKVTPKEKYNKI